MESKTQDVVELFTGERKVLNSGGTTIKIRYNSSLILTVDRPKLFENSLYFQASRKTCYEDHKSEYLEVNYSASNKVFRRVISFIITGKIDLNNKILFDCLALANYLQVDGLHQPCLDYFTYQLNSENVDERLELLESSHTIENIYKETAMSFKASGLPSYSGLYFLDLKGNYDAHLKMVYEGSESVHGISYLSPMLRDMDEDLRIFNTKDLIIKHVQNTLVLFIHTDNESGRKNCFMEFNLKTGKILQTTPVSKSRAIFSTSDKSLYVISSVEDGVKNESKPSSFLLSVFEESNGDKLKECKTKLFNFSNEEKVPNLKHIRLDFVQYDNEKLYMFYRDDYFGGIKYGNLYVLVICVKTLCILQNIKLELDQNNHKMSKVSWLEILFHMKKVQKMFIKVMYEDHQSILVFNIQNEKHNFTEDLKPIMLSFDYGKMNIYNRGIIRYSMKKDVLYAICRRYELDESEIKFSCPRMTMHGPLCQSWTEVRAFRYKNEKFVEVGTKWKSYVETEYSRTSPEVDSAVFV